MIDIALYILLGAFIGWHFPEPSWAKAIKAKFKDFLDRQDSKPVV